MNIDRIIRVLSWFLFLTGYQIYWYDHKKLRYRLTIVGIIYYIVLSFWYLVCVCHHFESSYLLKMIKDLSPFLSHLIRVQVFCGLTVLTIQIFESKRLRKVSNNLIHIFYEEIKSVKNLDKLEVLVYLMLFVTSLLTIAIGLYIAIELQFEVPPLDHIMIYMALFMPHFTLAGCLRLYTLCLWLTKYELVKLQLRLNIKDREISAQRHIVVEILNPGENLNCNDELYKKVLQRLDILAEFLKLFDDVLQRQLGLIVGINFNCMLTGIYCFVNYEKTWKVLLTTQYRRIFLAANSGIFACILADYGVFIFVCLTFCRAQRNFCNLIEDQLFGNNQNGLEMKTVLKTILYKLSKKLKLKLFCLVEFKMWDFLVFHSLMILLIALIIIYQYLDDQIKALNELFDNYDSN